MPWINSLISQTVFARLFSSQDITAVVTATIVAIEKDQVAISVETYGEAYVPLSEFAQEPINVGDTISVYRDTSASAAPLQWSRAKARRVECWQRLEAAYQTGQPVEGVISRQIKGGYDVDVEGHLAFLPSSEAYIRPVDEAASLLDTSHIFEITKMHRRRSSIVVSRRAILQRAPAEQQQIDFWKARGNEFPWKQDLALSEKLVDLVYDGLRTHFDIVKERTNFAFSAPEPTRDRAANILMPRILEVIASKAHRIRGGSVKNNLLISAGRFDYEFAVELSSNLPFRIDDATPFFETLRDDILRWLTAGHSIAGHWGTLVLKNDEVRFAVTPLEHPAPSSWEKPLRFQVR